MKKLPKGDSEFSNNDQIPMQISKTEIINHNLKNYLQIITTNRSMQ